MNPSTRRLAAAALVAGTYAALTMALAPISYSFPQFRVSEALCVLPAFFPGAAWGLFAGCAIANLISAAGPLDVVFGSLATLGASLCISRLGRGREQPLSLPRCLTVCLMPALWNGPVVGAVLTWLSAPAELFWTTFPLICAQIFAEELMVMLLLGLPLLRLLPRSKEFMRLIDKLLP